MINCPYNNLINIKKSLFLFGSYLNHTNSTKDSNKKFFITRQKCWYYYEILLQNKFVSFLFLLFLLFFTILSLYLYLSFFLSLFLFSLLFNGFFFYLFRCEYKNKCVIKFHKNLLNCYNEELIKNFDSLWIEIKYQCYPTRFTTTSVRRDKYYLKCPYAFNLKIEKALYVTDGFNCKTPEKWDRNWYRRHLCLKSHETIGKMYKEIINK